MYSIGFEKETTYHQRLCVLNFPWNSSEVLAILAKIYFSKVCVCIIAQQPHFLQKVLIGGLKLHVATDIAQFLQYWKELKVL